MKNFKQMIIDAGKEMVKRSLTVATWGNLSVRDPERGYIFVTPSRMDYNSLGLEDIVVFDKEGNWVEGERKPTIEKDLHILIYQNREDVHAVVHTHPLYSTVFAVTRQNIPPVTEEFAQLIGQTVVCAEYALPGTKALAQNTVKALGRNKAVLLVSHGTLCVGSDMETAFRVSDVLEKAAHILILSRSIGEPRIIPDEDIRSMQNS